MRDYLDPNKASWSKATVLQKTGTRNYLVKLNTSDRTIKRHSNQIVKDKVPVARDTEKITTGVEDKEGVVSKCGQQNQSPVFDNVSFKTVLSAYNNQGVNPIPEAAEEEEEEVLGFEEDHWHVKPENSRNRKRKQLFDLGLCGKSLRKKFR